MMTDTSFRIYLTLQLKRRAFIHASIAARSRSFQAFSLTLDTPILTGQADQERYVVVWERGTPVAWHVIQTHPQHCVEALR